MEQEIKGVIENVTEFKSGVTNNKPWTIYHLFINGQKFSAFDKTYKEMEGKEVTAKYTTEQKGQYTNLTLKDLNAKPSMQSQIDQLRAEVDQIRAHLVLDKPTPNRSEQTEPEPVPEPNGDEINIDDIPF